MTDSRIAFCLAQLEAALFASPRPLSVKALAQRLELSMKEVDWLLKRLIRELNAPSRGLQLREASGGWLLATKPQHEDVVRPARADRGELPLSAAALETLAAVALHQPITARGIYQLRGRNSEAVLQTLCKRGLAVRSLNHAENTGLWHTTGKFLEVCGLRDLNDLYRDGDAARIFMGLQQAGKASKAAEGRCKAVP